MGADGCAVDDRLCHIGHRMQGGSGHRGRDSDVGDAGWPARDQRAALCLRRRRSWPATDRPRGTDDSHVSHNRLLRRPAAIDRTRHRRRSVAALRRQVSGEQGARRSTLLAHSGDGGRVPRPGNLRRAEGDRWRQLPDPGERPTDCALCGRSRGRRDAQGPRASCFPFRVESCAPAAKSARRNTRT